MSHSKNVPRIVITGGPCGGKTTGLISLREKLLDIGFYPIMVPEVPTLLISSGITPIGDIFSPAVFEGFVLEQILSFERLAKHAVRHITHAKPIIIYDRGIMDIKAYVDDDVFEALLERHELTVPDVREHFCDAVFHLRTAAFGAEKFYTLKNNAARSESIGLAREIDERTLRAWIGHQHVGVIDNSTDFDGKMKRLFKGVCSILAIPAPLEIERKFLLGEFDYSVFAKENIGVATADIEQFYLMTPPGENPDTTLRVRRRTQYGSSIYWKTRKEYVESGTNIEKEEEITADEYEWSRAYMATGTEPVRKYRHCFVYENQYFELDEFEGRHHGLVVLEIELSDRGQEVILPPFLKIDREVTDDRSFSNRALAQLAS